MGLEAAVRIADPGACPVANASDQTGARIESVTRSSAAGTVIEEFEIDSCETAPDGTEAVFSDDRYSVYRFEREPETPCFCERIEEFGCPVVDIHADAGELRVLFRPTDVETLKQIVSALREEFGSLRLEHLVQSDENAKRDSVVVDRGKLTGRQREVLETAYEMGYFEHPKGANAQTVAAALDITPTTFAEHLSAAQSKLLKSVVEK